MPPTIIKSQLKKLLENVPKSWLGTTFPNDARFIGRTRFMDEMLTLLGSEDAPVEKHKLDHMFPEDYVRLGSPLSTVWEAIRAVEQGYNPHHVFSYGSATLPLIVVLLSATSPVFVYGQEQTPAVAAQEKSLKKFFGVDFTYCSGEPRAHANGVTVLVTSNGVSNGSRNPVVDALVSREEGLLFIGSPDKIPVDDVKNAKGDIVNEGVHTLRKRLGAPAPTPDVVARLSGQPLAREPDTRALKQHLKELAGCGKAKGDVLLGTTGLAALASCVMAAVVEGDYTVDLVMCSTAYGGSSQQADILVKKVPTFHKHTFDIQGGRPVFNSLAGKLEAMKTGPRKALTLIQLEYPTNPDMKDCNLLRLEEVILGYQKATGSKVVVMFDTTFSPVSRVAEGMFEGIAVIVFNSLSKSVSGGFTTGGSLVANHDALAQRVLSVAHEYLSLLDTGSKNCQLKILSERHGECEGRVAAAHKNAIVCAAQLEEVVKVCSGQAMKVNFVTAEQINKGVTPATFSFNLPAPAGASQAALEGLAQLFVDGLVEAHPKGIKPCVSFGQQNELVYVTVPATSTQGVLSAEAKAKQAIGGVQLVRFSFPPAMDMRAWNTAVSAAVKKMYQPRARL